MFKIGDTIKMKPGFSCDASKKSYGGSGYQDPEHPDSKDLTFRIISSHENKYYSDSKIVYQYEVECTNGYLSDGCVIDFAIEPTKQTNRNQKLSELLEN